MVPSDLLLYNSVKSGTKKTCSLIKYLIFSHLFTPLFQHSREAVPPFMSVNIDQRLHIETLNMAGVYLGN